MNRTILNGYAQMMLVKVTCTLCLIALLLTLLPSAPVAHAAYIEPQLTTAATQSVSVIVMGSNSQQVAKIVRRLGGRVTTDLWLIDAVAATMPVDQIERLSRQPQIHAVMANRGIQTADTTFDGWVNTRRIYQGPVTLANQLESSPVLLADGGIAAISAGGVLQIIEADGRERSRVSLPRRSYPISPISDNQSNLYLVKDESLLSFTSHGQLRWTFDNNKPFTALALAEGDSILYAIDSKDRLTALNLITGNRLWRVDIINGSKGSLVPQLTVVNGALYLSTDQGYVASFAANGRQKWVTKITAPFRQPPRFHSDGSVYIAGQDNALYGLDVGGNVKFRYQTDGAITAGPVVSSDGAIFAATVTGSLYALNQDGGLRFQSRPAQNEALLAVVPAPDAATVYGLARSGQVFALDAHQDALSWQAALGADVVVTPVVEVDGTLHVLDVNGKYSILNAFGVVTAAFHLVAADGQQLMLGVNPRRNVYIPTKQGTLHIFTRLPNQWDGRPDVQATTDPTVWKLANPVVADIGADLLHTPQLPGRAAVIGNGVTVAVLDSGVQFDPVLQQTLAGPIAERFMGQADFVEEICTTRSGVQQQGHCFVGANDSRDLYGHGTHVAGIIWNNFTDYATGISMGVAPGSNLLSVRVLDGNGTGSYADAIEGIQYVVANRDTFHIRVLNLSISAYATTPYFVDPLNRAVEKAWASGIVVVAAAGNEGPQAETITVPGNDPYVITVGAVDNLRTPGFWRGDTLPVWSGTGPTLDGFIKPDVLAPGAHIISLTPGASTLSQSYPANAANHSLFRMSGTSMATAVTSGVVALMLDANPQLTPDQVKFRVAYSARPATTSEGFPLYNILQQGMGRIWAPTAVLGAFPGNDFANQGMDLRNDLAHAWRTDEDLSFHYQGPIRRMVSDDGATYLYYTEEANTLWGLGAVKVEDNSWVSWQTLAEGMATWAGGQRSTSAGIAWAGGLTQSAGMATWAGGMATWAGGMATWAGGMATWAGGMATWAGGMATWAGGMATWAGGMATWAGGMATWAGGMATWAGGMATWAGGMATWAGGMATWAGGINVDESVLAGTSWVNDDGSTALLQSHTVFNPLPVEIEVQPAPGSDTGIQRIFIPVLSR